MTTAADIKAEAEASAQKDKAETAKASSENNEGGPVAPPSLPKRPVSPFTKSITELREAFPGDNVAISRAVLVAAGGNLEQAFNGMLALTDETIRPTEHEPVRSKRDAQIEEDEQLARRLAHKYTRNKSHGAGYSARYSDGPPPATGDDDDSFLGGVSQLWGSLREKIRNEMNDEDPPLPPPRQDRRRSSLESDGVIAMQAPNTPSDTAPALPRRRASSRPVNAFGDEIPHEPLRHDEPESETFFIGDESDDDLGSLDGEPVSASSRRESQLEPRENKESAKDLLSKVKGEAEKKTKE